VVYPIPVLAHPAAALIAWPAVPIARTAWLDDQLPRTLQSAGQRAGTPSPRAVNASAPGPDEPFTAFAWRTRAGRL
jgi:hypothetical protein